MPNELVFGKKDFTFSFEGKNEIEARQLGETLVAMSELITATAKSQDNETNIQVKIAALRKGSFEAFFQTIIGLVPNLLNNPIEAVAMAANIVTCVQGIFFLKTHLKARKAKKVTEHDSQTIEVQNYKGETMLVPNGSQILFNNCHIDNLVTNISEQARLHNPNGGFKIASSDKVFQCHPEDYDSLTHPITDKVELSKKYYVTADLLIKMADFIGHRCWEFKYQGHTIQAKISDSNWLDRVHSGNVQIKAGDQIRANLEIEIPLDIYGNDVSENAKYAVTKVIGGIWHKDSQLIIPNM